jgi:hypothetical protein
VRPRLFAFAVASVSVCAFVCVCVCVCVCVNGCAALHMACTNGQIKIVEALMAKNIPADPVDKYALCVTQIKTQTN